MQVMFTAESRIVLVLYNEGAIIVVVDYSR